jgi:hypothetical protein
MHHHFFEETKKSKNREFDKELLQFNLRQERAEKQGGGARA